MIKKGMRVLQTGVALLVFSGMVLMSGCSEPDEQRDDPSDQTDIPDVTVEHVTETAPQDGLALSALSNGENAESIWKIALNESAAEVSVWVKDVSVVCGETERQSDGVCLYLSKASGTWGYTVGSSSRIFAFPDGRITGYQAKDGQTMESMDFGASARVYSWAEQGDVACGYKVVFTVPYSSIGADKDSLAIAPTLHNVSFPSFDATVRAYSLTDYGTDLFNQNTWPVAQADGSLRLNTEPYPTGEFSYKSSVNGTENSYWDLSEDYLSSDSRYPERRVELTDTLGNGNYNILNFYRTNGRLFYCESVFTLPEDPVHMFDPAPKFGFRLLDSNSNGLYFYIDALVSSFTGNIVGTSAGYCPVTNGALDWSRASSKNVGYSAEKPVQLALFRHDGVVKLIVNDEVIFSFDDDAGIDATAAIMPSVFSFNLGLILTDYRSTTDESDPMIRKYLNDDAGIN